MFLNEALPLIEGLNNETIRKTKLRLDNLTKPLGSLGRLEDIVCQLGGITGETFPNVDKKVIIIMCSDNGVVEEGVTQTSKEVTSIVTRNFTKGFTGINVLSKHAGAEIAIVDIGIDDDIYCEGVINKKIRKGTWNIAKGPAMTRDEAIRAIEVGIEIVSEMKNKGINLLGTGEMGIGNTTTSSAITAFLTSSPVEDVVGRGAGLSTEGLAKKINVVRESIFVNKPDNTDPIDVLSKLGGFDIAGLVGCFIGAAAFRIPIMIDGFISATAALIAIKIKPEVKYFILPSHGSAEPGNKVVMKELGIEPMLNLEMRLGEGTGCAIAFHIIDAGLAAYKLMGTFGDASIEQYVPQI